MKSTTYKESGVDVDAGNALARWIANEVRGKASRPEVVGGIGAFAGLFALPAGLRDPLLVAATDGVGTKLKLAFALDRHDTVGIDLVAMSVNDVITCGAEPLFFLDYLATGRLRGETAKAVLAGIIEGCRQSGCALLGGETAEMPGMYAEGEYDLAGFVVGVVERQRLIDGRAVRPGDAVIGLPSSGLHSNGFSLARRVLVDAESDPDLSSVEPKLGRPLGDALLEPTRIYVEAVRRLRRAAEPRALVHITGGGLIDNPPRAVPDGLGFRLHQDRWSVPAIFDLVAERGNVAVEEMRRTFNMGLGMLAVVPAAEAAAAEQAVRDDGGRVVGEIVADPTTPVEWA